MPYHIMTNAELDPWIMEMVEAVDCKIHLWREDGSNEPDVLNDADGFFVYGHPIIDGAVMDTMPNLRVISNQGVGIDHINLDDAKSRGIPVGNTPGFVDGATADMTFALLLAAARYVVAGDHFARSPNFTHYDPNIWHGQEVYGSTLGIVGMGGVGQQVARRAIGFDMDVLYHNRHEIPDIAAKLGATYASLPDLLAKSDFVALNLPMKPDTRHIIGQAELAMMKSTAILINAARGGVLDHNALVDALRNGTIWAAGLDVTEPEPLPRDHPLLSLENVVIAPHLGSATRKTRVGMVQRTIDNLIAALTSQPMPSRVA
ncbi:MAG: D-glycerate dehydrogenase [Pseudomonadota bacterium]|nr:D-glycerate dehydrogenase [Pseudomonadota bacterium]